MIISDEDIRFAEKILLPGAKHFDSERRTFIRTLTSCDVVACPGSGKTTSLLAKLLILSRKMPFPDGRGICILTHTNVAIDEIKNKLSKQANTLHGYPNFFGTIQSFVDRFLAIPAFYEMKKFRPDAPDDEYYYTKLEKLLSYKARAYLGRKNAPIAESLKKIKFEFNIRLGTLTINCDDIGLKLNTSETFKNIDESCQKFFDEGLLTYGQMYQLANDYIARHPEICTLFNHRFCYLLIDEMQDTDERQNKLLEKLFRKSDNCIIQRVGDPNQAIFNSTRNEKIWTPRKPILHFSKSMRFGRSIATLLDTVRTDRQVLLDGSNDVQSLPPKMLFYSDKNMDSVIKAFWALICKHNLNSSTYIEHKKFYAVGWRKEHDTTGITHYWPGFQSKKAPTSFGSLFAYIEHALLQSCELNSTQILVRNIWDGLAKFSNLLGSSERRTGRVLNNEIRLNHPGQYLIFKQKLASRLLSSYRTKNADVIHKFTINSVLRFLDYQKIKLSRNAERFLKNVTHEFDGNKECNMCSFDGEYVNISTIHGVKGQTHTATMLMETKYQKNHESEYLHRYLCGEYATPSQIYLQQCLRMAHVAISRPTHLFVMACHESRLKEHQNNLVKAGWVVYTVAELIANEEV